MNILAALPTYRPPEYNKNIGGGEISNRILLEGLVKRGHTVSVVAITGTGQPYAKVNGVDVIESKPVRMKGKLGRLLAIKNFQPSVYTHAKILNPDILLTATSGVFPSLSASRIRRIPVGVFIRASENFPKKTKISIVNLKKTTNNTIERLLLGNYDTSVLNKVDFLLPNSKYMEKRCWKLCHDVETHIIYPPLASANILWPIKSSPIKTVSMVGTNPQKGTDLVVALAKIFPKIEFRIIGLANVLPGKIIKKGNLTLMGWCNVSQEFFKKTDLVLVPSLGEEAFGRVAVEGLAVGKIVLASNIGGLPEALNYEKNLLVEPGDIHAWAERLGNVLKNPVFFREASKRAYKNIKKFSSQIQIDVLEAILYTQIEKAYKL